MRACGNEALATSICLYVCVSWYYYTGVPGIRLAHNENSRVGDIFAGKERATRVAYDFRVRPACFLSRARVERRVKNRGPVISAARRWRLASAEYIFVKGGGGGGSFLCVLGSFCRAGKGLRFIRYFR